MQFTIPANTPRKPFNKHWQHCVGSGHAAFALRRDYTEQLTRIHTELGIQRVRFHGIFCDDMHTLHRLSDLLPLPGAKKLSEQSFRYCGLAYDNVRRAGMQPFVELGFMPKHLAKRQKKGMFFYKPIVSMPKSDAAWAKYIGDFMRYLIRRYGLDEVRTWFFEVWNEPDLRIAFFDGTQADYFHLYEITARAIKAVDNQLMVGGPATSGSKWVSDFVAFCEKNSVPVDFITTHQYAGDPLGGVQDDTAPAAGQPKEKAESVFSGINLFRLLNVFKGMEGKTVLEGLRRLMRDPSEEKNIPNNTFKTNAPIVKRQAKGLPVYFTEWNESAVFSAYTNDTRKVAAYDVKTILDIENDVTGSSVWCFSDIFEELHPFPEEFHGGFGMLTQHGIPKPVFHALKMLHMAGGERYDLPGAMDGEISLAAFHSGSEMQVLLTRQKMKNLDLPKEEATVSIALPAAPKALVLNRIDETHCNPLKAWEEMGSTLDLTPAEVEDIKSKTAMNDEPIEYTYENGILTFSAALGVNDVYFTRITL